MRDAGRVAIAKVEGAREVVAEGVPKYEVVLVVHAAETRKAALLLDLRQLLRVAVPHELGGQVGDSVFVTETGFE